MKKTRRIIGLLLVALLVVNATSFALVFGSSLGDSLFESSLGIGSEINLAKGVYWNTSHKEKITENYIVYEPGYDIKPIISHGNDIHGAASFRAVVNKAKAEGQHVVAGLNGDFFDMNTGVPLGITIKEGLLLNSGSSQRPVLGFLPDGNLIIGEPGKLNLDIKATGDTILTGFGAMNYNKTLTNSSGVVLYTRVFADDKTNKSKIASYNVLLKVDSDEIRVNNNFQGTVVNVQESTGPTFIPEGHILLSSSLKTQYTGSLDRLRMAAPGDVINFSVTADHRWNDVEYAIGAGAMIVKDGKVVTQTERETHPRTAVGIRADGSAVFYTVDGRQAGHSRGLRLDDLAKRMIELGCVTAVNMDGGGSTAIHGIYPGEENIGVINQPSQSSLRNCANYILLINTQSPVGYVSNLHLYPYQARILAGSEIAFKVKASDYNYYPVSAPGQLSFTYTGDVGNMEKANRDYLFTASKTKTSGTVTASYGGGVTGSANLEIVERPDSISFSNQATGGTLTSLVLFSGDKIDLKAEATYKRMPLLSSDRAYTWTLTGDIGTIDEEGVFTASEINKGSGKITASVNGISASINVSIQSEGWLVESFEEKINFFRSTSVDGGSVKVNDDLTRVKYGFKSGLVTYDFDLLEGGEGQDKPERISLPVRANFAKAPKMMAFYLYGDGSANEIELQVTTGAGKQTLKAAAMDFKGWKLITVSLPSGTTSLDGINIFKAGKAKGSFYLDQFVAGVDYYVDTQAPQISMAVVDGHLTATVKDDIDPSVDPGKIKLTLDGKELDFQFDGNTGLLQRELNVADTYLHRVAIVASDETGNLARKSLAFVGTGSGLEGEEAGQENNFIDTNGHWAKENIDYLYRLNIINGVNTDQGLAYRPNRSITRAEFAVLMKNWMGKKADAYVGTSLPFLDNSSIPAWALDSVQAMYGMGIVTGTGTNKGVVFNPSGPISRQEVMTIIGRTQARGYGEASLSSFTDNKDVSSWAQPYVSSLVKQEVVSGSGGKLNPKNSITRAEVATIITGLN